MIDESKKRIRNIQLKIYVDEAELAAIEENMKRAKIKKKGEYIRQMCIFGKVIYIDDLLFRKCYDELHRIGVNLNQIAKYANSTGIIYKEDIEMIKDSSIHMTQMLNSIFHILEELVNEVKKSGFETLSQQIRRIYKEKME